MSETPVLLVRPRVLTVCQGWVAAHAHRRVVLDAYITSPPGRTVLHSQSSFVPIHLLVNPFSPFFPLLFNMRFSVAAAIVALSAATSAFADVSMSKSGGDGKRLRTSPSRPSSSLTLALCSTSHLLLTRPWLLRPQQRRHRLHRRRRSRDHPDLPWGNRKPQPVRSLRMSNGTTRR